jgi:hypothetical protein
MPLAEDPGFRRYWRWKSRSLGGRPQIDADLRALIRRMSVDNLLWGAPHIHGELLKLGFAVAQSTVAKYMTKRPDPSAQGWGTFDGGRRPFPPVLCGCIEAMRRLWTACINDGNLGSRSTRLATRECLSSTNCPDIVSQNAGAIGNFRCSSPSERWGATTEESLGGDGGCSARGSFKYDGGRSGLPEGVTEHSGRGERSRRIIRL